MNVDTFLIRLVLLVIPGYVGYKTYRIVQSTGKSRKRIKEWQDLVAIIFLSVLSYGLLFLVYQVIQTVAAALGAGPLDLTVTSIAALINTGVSLNFFEILYASLLGMVVGLVAAVLYNRKVLFKVAEALKLTAHYGDDDVWSYVTNSDDVQWLLVRDHKVGLVYFGYVSVFSDSDEKRELLLEDVDVYSNKTGAKLYHTESLYICREDNELTLEIPKQGEYSSEPEAEEKDVRPGPETAKHPRRDSKKRGH
ncbi:MAG TPA: DUF6338 family protein [Spirochaetia bacterium]|nr:DUF6338 family protein [Spirochaetia bacterium]